MSKQLNTLLPGVYAAKGQVPRTLLVVVGPKCIYTDHDVNPLLEDHHDGHPPPGQRAGVIPVSTCTTGGFRRVVGDNPTRPFTIAESSYLATRMFPLRSNRRRNRFERTVFAEIPENQDIHLALVPQPTTGTPPRPEPPKASIVVRLTQRLQKLWRWIKLAPAGSRRQRQLFFTISDN